MPARVCHGVPLQLGSLAGGLSSCLVADIPRKSQDGYSLVIQTKFLRGQQLDPCIADDVTFRVYKVFFYHASSTVLLSLDGARYMHVQVQVVCMLLLIIAPSS